MGWYQRRVHGTDCSDQLLMADIETSFSMVDFPLLQPSVFTSICQLCNVDIKNNNNNKKEKKEPKLGEKFSRLSKSVSVRNRNNNHESENESLRKEWDQISMSFVKSCAFATLKNIFTSSRYIELLLSSKK